MRLGRPATGLPRYFMDCGWYRHPHFAGLPVEALFTFEAIVGYATEHATDGAAPANVEDLAAVLGLRSSVVKRGLKPLLDRGRLDRVEDRVVVAGWADHNPTAEDVAAYTSAKSQAGQLGNHQRHHVAKGIVNPDCPLCDSQNDRTSDRTSDRTCDPKRSQNGSHGMGWDGIGTSSSSSGTPPEATPQPDDDDDPVVREARRRTALEVHRRTGTDDEITSPEAFYRRVRDQLRADHWTPPGIAPTEPRRDCARCSNRMVIELPDGRFAACPDCSPHAHPATPITTGALS